MRDYEYKGFIPYGAGEMHCLDYWVEDDFSGNVVEQILTDKTGEFIVLSENTAVLKMLTYDIPFRKEA